MKKVLAVIAVLILSAGGYFFYQRNKAAQALGDFSKEQSYKGFGINLELFPGSAKVQGWWKPALSIDRVTVSLLDIPDVPPKSFVGARIEMDVTKPDTLRLVAPKIDFSKDGGALEGLYFLLKKDKTISEIGFETATVKENNSSNVITTVQHGRAQLENWVGFIPDHVSYSIDKIEMTEGQEPQVTMGAIEFNLDSQKQGERRNWKVNFRGKGGRIKPEKEVEISLEPWSGSMEGSANEIPKDTEIAALKDLIGKVAAAFKDPKTESEPSGAMPNLNPMMGPVEALIDHIVQLGVQPEKSDFHWGGLKGSGKEGFEIEISPMDGKGSFHFKSDSFGGDSSLALAGVKLKGKDGAIDLKDLKLSYGGEYHISYASLMKGFLNYYKRILTDTFSMRGMGSNPLAYLASAYANYPEQAVYEIKLGSISYSTKEVSGENRDLTIGFKLEPKAVAYYVSDKADVKFPTNSSNDVKGGSLNFSLAQVLPWEKLLGAMRDYNSGKTQAIDWSFLSGERGGLDWKIDADGGSNWFAGKVSLNVQDELGKYLKIYLDTVAAAGQGGMRDMEDIWTKNVAKEFVAKASVDFSLNILRLSRFQALLDLMEPGSSMGLMALGPYIVVDTKADTLSVTLTLKDGKVLLNGQENERINQMLQVVR